MYKILIMGSSGLVGSSLYDYLSSKYKVLGVDSVNSQTADQLLDLKRSENYQNIIEQFSPNLILNCAGIKDLIHCENNRNLAWDTNYRYVLELAETSSRLNINLIHLSSDMVFSGGRWYDEFSPLRPLNWYGATKAAAEIAIIQSKCRGVSIFRLSQVIPKFSNEMVDVLITELHKDTISNQSLLPYFAMIKLKYGEKIKLPSNKYSTPITTEFICKIVEKCIITNYFPKIMNVAGKQSYSRYSMIIKVAKMMGLNTKLITEGEDETSKLRPNYANLRSHILLSRFPEIKNENIANFLIKSFSNDQNL